MAITNISQYYNLYDSTKGYTELLFRAGRILQSKELNEMQSMIKNQIKNVGDTILTNGDIIEGCQLLIDLEAKTATITKGKLYLNGDVRPISDTTVNITGEGTETIGVLLKNDIITADDDEDLNDVASGYDNYNQDGAYRLKETVQITVNDSDASVLYTIQDGIQLSVNTSEDLTQLDKINATLARRTFDESGNYKVNGLKLVDKEYSDTNKIYISMESGKAYVKGYEVNKISSTNIGLDRPTDLKLVENEPKIYNSSTSSYPFSNGFVKRVTKLVAIVQSVQSITRGSQIGGIDYLPLTPVVSVLSVKQGDKTFVQGHHFQLLNDGIDWSIFDSSYSEGITAPPNPGTTYSVTWNYTTNLTEGVDYNVVELNGAKQIVFTSGGLKPVESSSFYVNYQFTLCRRDVISLDKDGMVIITKGQPDILRTVESPSVDVNSVLVLGSVLLKPDTNEIAIINNATQTIPMIDLYKILDRVSALEYNVAITDLDKEAAEGENATELMGVLTDGFLGTTKSDVYHSEWDASIDLDNQELTLPYTPRTDGLVVNKSSDYNMGTFNRLMTAPYSTITLVSQSSATGSIRINSYNAFPKRPSVKLSPEVDNWVDQTEIVIDGGTRTKTITLRRWWYHKGESWAESEKALWQSFGLADGGSSLGWSSTSTSSVNSVVNSILNEAIMYMRTNTVKVTVTNLTANIDNITATFDGKAITLTPLSSAYKGTQTGTLKANAKGETYGSFNVPSKTLCGTKELKIYPVNTPSLNGTANYTSVGRKITTTRTVWTQVTNLQATDPIAQSFQFDMDQFVTGVGIYFLDKDTVEPITVQLRNMVNGYPGTTCYAEKVIQPNAITISQNASIETKVMFDDPVYCNANEQYCFTILSNSDIDSVWMCETTKNDINKGTQVTKNPYLNGTMFSSSNALTWTAHQSSDLKFNIYGAKFETEGHAYFNVVNMAPMDRIMIASEQTIPTGCSISWQYAINGSNNFQPIEIYDDRDLNELATSITIKVTIVANSYTSPAIALDSLLLCTFANKLTGTYISKNVYLEEGYNNVKQIVDLHLPANTNVVMYYAKDKTGTTWIPLSSTHIVTKSTTYKTYTFEGSVGSTAHNYRCKIVLTTTNQASRPTAMNLRSIMKVV